MSSTKAGAVILAWFVLMAATVPLTLLSPFFAGMTVGGALTAGMLLLAVKWSVEGMLTGMTGNIEQMQEALSDDNEMLYGREE